MKGKSCYAKNGADLLFGPRCREQVCYSTERRSHECKPSVSETMLQARILAVATLLLLSITACNKLPPTYNGIDITGAETQRGFQLQDSQGKVRSPAISLASMS